MAQGAYSGAPLGVAVRVGLSYTPFSHLRARLPLAWRGGEPLHFVITPLRVSPPRHPAPGRLYNALNPGLGLRTATSLRPFPWR